jgi:hypothetical protein
MLAFADNQGVYFRKLLEGAVLEASCVYAAQNYLLAERSDQLEVPADELTHRGHARQADDPRLKGAKPLEECAGVEAFTGRVYHRYSPSIGLDGGCYREQAQRW